MKKIVFLSMLVFLIACNKNEIHGIRIGNTLVENQTHSENQTLILAIENVLQLKHNSLPFLMNINCGGAAGCYDLGDVVVQIINKVGEDKFIELVTHLNHSEKSDLKNLIEVGLEYGLRLDKNAENNRIDKEFPKLTSILNN